MFLRKSTFLLTFFFFLINDNRTHLTKKKRKKRTNRVSLVFVWFPIISVSFCAFNFQNTLKAPTLLIYFSRQTFILFNFTAKAAAIYNLGLFFFFQNNTHFQTILLISKISKLFRKLAFQVF